MASFNHLTGKEADRRFATSRVHGITREYMEYLKTLQSEGGIGVLKPGRGENLVTLRNRVRRAAGVLGVRAQTQRDGNELIVIIPS